MNLSTIQSRSVSSIRAVWFDLSDTFSIEISVQSGGHDQIPHSLAFDHGLQYKGMPDISALGKKG